VAAAWRTGPLSLPGFRLLTFGQLTSTIGDYCYAVALPWLVLSGGGTATSLGIVLACYGIPRAVLTVPGGSLADRLGARRVMLTADLARCALTAALAVLGASHDASLAVLAPVAALLGAASALFMPASMTMMPSLVDGERLTSANAVYTGFVQTGSMLGPVLGGVLVAATGPAPGFVVDAGSYLASAVSLGLIARLGGRPSRGAPAGRTAAGPVVLPTEAEALAAETVPTETVPAEALAAEAARAEAAQGNVWTLLRQSRFFQIILIVSVTANFALTGTTEVALPALAHARFGADGYGAVLTCVAAASIVGALVVARAGDRFRPVTLVGGALIAAGAAIAAAPFLGGLPGLAAGMAVFGLSIGFDQVISVTLIQRWAPPALLGRVWGLLLLAGAGSFPVSTFVAGLLARHLGPVAVFPLTGALLVLAIAFGLTQRKFREFGTRPGE
jgi:MFS family permease